MCEDGADVDLSAINVFIVNAHVLVAKESKKQKKQLFRVSLCEVLRSREIFILKFEFFSYLSQVQRNNNNVALCIQSVTVSSFLFI